MLKPLIPLTLAYAAGLLLGQGFLFFPHFITILLFLVILSISIIVLLNRLSFRRALLFAVPGLVGIAAYLYSALWLPPDHYTRVVADDNAVHVVTGRISSALDRDPDRTAFVLDLFEIDNRPVSGSMRVSVREAVTTAGYGDTVRISGKVHKPGGFNNPGGFDYPSYLAKRGVYRTVSVKNAGAIRVVDKGTGFFRTIQDWRERIRQSFLSSVSGPGSAILQAMVLGEEGGLTDDMRDRFQAAGVTHIISISGSHLGMISLVCFGLIRLLMLLLPERLYHLLTIHADPKKIAAWIVFPLVLFYTLLAGGQTATVRSLIMLTAALSALILDRENALGNTLSAAALLILLTSPQALFDISFQLSFISVLCISQVVLLWSDLRVSRNGIFRKLGWGAILLILISLATSLVTGPLTVHYFNQFSLAGLVSNLVIVPFAGMIVVPLGFFSGILSLFTNRLMLPGLNQAAADAFVGTVGFFSRLPMAEFHPPSPGIVRLLVYAILIVSVFKLLRARLLFSLRPLEYSSRTPRGPLFAVLLSSLFLFIAAAATLLPGHAALLSFPDVGQGDSALIQLQDGRNILIDGGGSYDDRFDIGRRVLAPFLWNRGVRRLDLVILTHPHPDHLNGLKFIVRKFDIGQVWTHGYDGNLPGTEEFSRILAERHISRRIVSPGMPSVQIGEAELRVLHPARTFNTKEKRAYAAENDRSLVVRADLNGQVLLFTGDIGREAERELIRSKQDLRCDLLKVPHHGSRSSSSEKFVSATHPATAVVTVGTGNRYRHPSDEVIQRYRQLGARIFRTDLHGWVMLELSRDGISAITWSDFALRKREPGGHFSFEQERENWKRLWLRKWEL